MKAIKLASVFAVSAVAAAVSSTTFAATPAANALVITGDAGIEYVSVKNATNSTSSDVSDVGNASGTNNGEIELHIDNGIIYSEIEFKTNGDGIDSDDENVDLAIEKLYVKQGAVSFGRFDGTVATGAFFGMDEIGYSGVDLKTGQGDTDDTGVRYKVTPELTVSLEATPSQGTDDSEIGAAFSYVVQLDGVKLGLSAGSVGDSNAYNIGAQSVFGPATVSLNYGGGDRGVDGNTDAEEYGASIALAATEALTLTLQYADQTNKTNGVETSTDGTYFVAEYVVGDLTYYFKNYDGKIDTERNIVGVKASF